VTTATAEARDFWKIGAIAVAVLATLVVYFGTARSIVDIWNSSETFAHGYIIVPISAWLIWRRRHTLPMDAARPYWPALLLLAACGFGWLLADLASVQVVKQYTFVAMIPIIALAVLGPTVAAALAFPLLFLMFAVPFGEVLIQPLIEFTADFTVAALQATGIPVLRNGTHFDIPSGSWSVVEACSGIRYLISSVTLGCLYAYLSYRSWSRRALFIVVAIIVPIIANGLRAYMIVMIGHLSGMKLAVGVDHLIYGWLFFGLVMFVMFWIGRHWREDLDDDVTPAPPRPVQGKPQRLVGVGSVVAAAGACVLCIGVWPAYARYLDRPDQNQAPVAFGSFTKNWSEIAPFTAWKPRFMPASGEMVGYFQRDAKQVGLSILYYRDTRRDSQLVSSLNRTAGEKDSAYREVANNLRKEIVAGESLTVHESRLEGATGPLLVWYWYRIDGTSTANDYTGKMLLAKEKLTMRGSDGAAVFVFAPYAAKPEEARAVFREYLADNLSLIETAVAANSRHMRRAQVVGDSR
jgi:exosortase A